MADRSAPPPSDTGPRPHGHWVEVGEVLADSEIAALGPDDVDGLGEIPPDHIIERDGRAYIWQQMSAAEVTLQEGDAKIGPIVVPFDASTSPGEEDLIRLAAQFRHDVQAIDAQIGDGEVAELVVAMEESGLFRSMIDQATAAAKEGVRVAVSITDEVVPDDLTPEEAEAFAAEATGYLHDEITNVVEKTFLTGADSAVFKAQMARDIINHAWAWAVEDARDGMATAPGPSPLSEAEFDAAVKQRFSQGSYITRAMLTLAPATISRILEITAEGLDANPDLGKQLLDAARERKRRSRTPAIASPTMQPGFVDGVGMALSNQLFDGVIIAMQRVSDWGVRERPVGWESDAGDYPYFQHAGETWGVNYHLTSEHYPVPAEAWEALRQLDDDAGDVAYVAIAQWLANQHKDPRGLAYITVDQILEQLGRAKHVNGGYRPEQRREVSQKFWALSRLTVEGRGFHEYQTDGKGKKQKVRIQPQGAFVVIPVWENQQALEGSPPLTRGFYFSVGEWVRPFVGDEGTRQFARMMQGILQYRSVQDRIPKRIGKRLVLEHRLRAHQQNWKQPIFVSTLLQKADIEIPTSNPLRFINKVEAALSDLKARGFIGEWWYVENDPLPDRNRMQAWLSRRLVILPSSETTEAYAKIGRRRPRAISA